MTFLLPATILLFAVWPAYALLLRYSERYVLNRLLLLLAMVAVCALPFVPFASPAPVATETIRGTIEYVEQATQPSVEILPAEQVAYNGDAEGTPYTEPRGDATGVTVNTLNLIYFGGAAVLFLVLGFRLLFLFVLHLRSRPNGDGSYRLLHPGARPGQAFTFLHNVYFSIDVPDGPDFDHVLTHECIHARQAHTVDILLSEVFLCLFWFHPTAWWLRNQLRANLEFLVDHAVISGGANRRDYQLALLRQSQGAQGLALALPFSEPSLKSRIARLTGLPEYRVIAVLAAVAVVFWLGVTVLVVRGTVPMTADYATHQLNRHGKPTATEFLYSTHFAQPLPDKIESFELHFKRLPTTDEYVQIKSILSHIPHTNFNIYHPCYGDEERYVMQLSHYLKQEAVFNSPLSVGDRLAYHWTFVLKARETASGIPTGLPHNSYGYFEPTINQTVVKVIKTEYGYEGVRDKDQSPDYPLTINPYAKSMQIWPHRPEIAQEELAIFINGERFHLLERPDTKYGDGMQYAGYAEKDFWVAVEGKEDDHNSYPLEMSRMGQHIVSPPNARMACLLGLGKDTKGMTRRLQFAAPEKVREYLDALNDLQFMNGDINKNIYLNDQAITLELLRELNFPSLTIIDEGGISGQGNKPSTVHLITDSRWR